MSKLYRCPTCGNEYCDKDSPHMVKTLKANLRDGELAELKAESSAWREAFVMLINSLPQPTKSVVCARFATIPSVWTKLSKADKAQATAVLKEAGVV